MPVKKKQEPKNLFPHSEFPFRLEYMDGNDKIICWFSSKHYLDKHIKRYKLNKKKIKIDERETPNDGTQSKSTTTHRKTRKKN